eukprot:7387152-Prymnesium_polylepis.1
MCSVRLARCRGRGMPRSGFLLLLSARWCEPSVDVAIVRRALVAIQALLPLGRVPAASRLVPASKVLDYVGAELAVALRRTALLDARAACLHKLGTTELRTLRPLLRRRLSAEARAKLRLAKFSEQNVQVARLCTSRVQVVECIAVRVDAQVDSDLLLVLVVRIRGELRVPELVDNLQAHLRVGTQPKQMGAGDSPCRSVLQSFGVSSHHPDLPSRHASQCRALPACRLGPAAASQPAHACCQKDHAAAVQQARRRGRCDR